MCGGISREFALGQASNIARGTYVAQAVLYVARHLARTFWRGTAVAIKLVYLNSLSLFSSVPRQNARATWCATYKMNCASCVPRAKSIFRRTYMHNWHLDLPFCQSSSFDTCFFRSACTLFVLSHARPASFVADVVHALWNDSAYFAVLHPYTKNSR